MIAFLSSVPQYPYQKNLQKPISVMTTRFCNPDTFVFSPSHSTLYRPRVWVFKGGNGREEKRREGKQLSFPDLFLLLWKVGVGTVIWRNYFPTLDLSLGRRGDLFVMCYAMLCCVWYDDLIIYGC